MVISEIEIKSVKGISDKRFVLKIMPNKPNLIVAPNGFGKSSIATAFASMNKMRLKLEEKDCHEGVTIHPPELNITVNGKKLSADETKNDILKQFDVIVINSGLIPKGKKGFKGSVSSTLETKSIQLCKIPEEATFSYRITDIRAAFGTNGKVLPNIKEQLHDPLLATVIMKSGLYKIGQEKIKKALSGIAGIINKKKGSKKVVLEWVKRSYLERLRSIKELNELSKGLMQSIVRTEVEAFLFAYQIAAIYVSDHKAFKTSVNWLDYKAKKISYCSLLSDFCSSGRRWAKLVELKKSSTLSVVFLKAHQVSNGERDLMTLIIQLHKVREKDSKRSMILIIDEVFDYLDDANLMTFQYYVTTTIEEYKKHDKIIYPIILTHLDPGVFFDFCFNKHKIHTNYFPKTQKLEKEKHTLNLIKARNDHKKIKGRLERYWFHYHINIEKICAKDWPVCLPDKWRSSLSFHEYTKNELISYTDDKNYDRLAVCFAVRVGIEQLAYELLLQDDHKCRFLNEKRTTKNKIDFAASCVINIPETYFFLGLIYNPYLHWKEERDYVSPLATKFKHPIIKLLIKKLTCQILKCSNSPPIS